MKNKCPVFIVGPGRSGTSLLYRILQKHPVFEPQNCAVRVDLTESQVFSAPESICDKERTPGVGAYSYMLFDDSLFSEFTSSFYWTVRWQRMLGTSILSRGHNIFASRLSFNGGLRKLFWRLYRGPTTVRRFFETARKARGVERILEKTPQHLQRIPEIKYTYPECRIVGITRHPIDVFTSHRRRYQAERRTGASGDQVEWLNITVEQFCERFAVYEDIIRHENSRNDGGFIWVRYEDLTTSPQKTLQRILLFLGEDYEEKCVVKDETNQLYWEIDPYLFDEIYTKTKDWRVFIEQDEAEYIETTLKPQMKRLGYQRYTQKRPEATLEEGLNEF
jgi:hypothetical protein